MNVRIVAWNNRVASASRPGQVVLYPYNSCDWLRIEGGDFRDGSCRPDPDFATKTLGLCRPLFRAAIHRQWRAAQFANGLDFAFFTRTRSGPDFAVVAWLTLANVFASHAAAVSAGCRPTLNLMTPGSCCLSGTTYRGRYLPASTPCGCLLYGARVRTPYLTFSAPARESIRVNAPLRLSFSRLQVLLPAYFASRWPAGVERGKFMQSGQGWGHRITHAGDIRRLWAAFHQVKTRGGARATRQKVTSRQHTKC